MDRVGRERASSPAGPATGQTPHSRGAAAAALRLQSAAGNAAVGRMLARDAFTNAPDAKHWKRDQKWRQWRAKELKLSEPKKSEGGFEEPLDVKAMEAIITAGGEKLEGALKHYAIPQASEIGKDETREERLVLDIKSGAEKTREYLDYFTQVVDWVKLTGKSTDLGPMLNNLRQVAGEMSKRLNQADQIMGLIEDVQDARRLMQSVQKFSDAMDGPITAQNVEQWIDAAEGLFNTLLPYAEKAQDAMLASALRGGATAARGFLVVGYVAFQIQGGLQLLRAGTRYAERHNAVLKAYLDDPWEAEVARERRAKAAQAERDRIASMPPPTMPAGWMSRDDQVAAAKRSAEWGRKQELRRRWQEQRANDQAWAMKYFEAVVWPALYKGWRPSFQNQLAREWKTILGDQTYRIGRMSSPKQELYTMDEYTWLRVMQANTAKGRAAEIATFEEMGKPGFAIWTTDGTLRPRRCHFYDTKRNAEKAKYLRKSGMDF